MGSGVVELSIRGVCYGWKYEMLVKLDALNVLKALTLNQRENWFDFYARINILRNVEIIFEKHKLIYEIDPWITVVSLDEPLCFMHFHERGSFEMFIFLSHKILFA